MCLYNIHSTDHLVLEDILEKSSYWNLWIMILIIFRDIVEFWEAVQFLICTEETPEILKRSDLWFSLSYRQTFLDLKWYADKWDEWMQEKIDGWSEMTETRKWNGVKKQEEGMKASRLLRVLAVTSGDGWGLIRAQ